MTLSELLKYVVELMEIKGLSPETKVFVASDEEGNSFHPLSCITTEYTQDSSEWEIDVTEEIEILEEGNKISDYEKILIIWP